MEVLAAPTNLLRWHFTVVMTAGALHVVCSGLLATGHGRSQHSRVHGRTGLACTTQAVAHHAAGVQHAELLIEVSAQAKVSIKLAYQGSRRTMMSEGRALSAPSSGSTFCAQSRPMLERTWQMRLPSGSGTHQGLTCRVSHIGFKLQGCRVQCFSLVLFFLCSNAGSTNS